MIRVVIVFLQLILCFLLQSTVMPAFAMADVVPDLMLILIAELLDLRLMFDKPIKTDN